MLMPVATSLDMAAKPAWACRERGQVKDGPQRNRRIHTGRVSMHITSCESQQADLWLQWSQPTQRISHLLLHCNLRRSSQQSCG